MYKEIEFDHILDLSVADDVDALIRATKNIQNVGYLVHNNISLYIKYFPDSHWRKIYSGGLVSIQASPMFSQSFIIDQLMIIAEALEELKDCAGFDELLKILKNLPQIKSTFFEILVAQWCIRHRLHKALSFSPEVVVNGHIKRPEFKWVTLLGEVYCECKSAANYGNDIQKKLNRLNESFIAIYEKYEGWNKKTRLRVRIDSMSGNWTKSFEHIVKEAFEASQSSTEQGQTFSHGSVSAVFVSRSEDMLHEPDVKYICTAKGEVPGQAFQLRDGAFSELRLSVANGRASKASELMKDAKTQLPTDRFGAIFIELDAVSPAAQAKMQSIMELPNFAPVAFASQWVNGQLAWVACHDNQPFNADNLL